MYRFIESIRLENGKFPLLEEHQLRLNKTFNHFGHFNPFLLDEIISVPEEYLNDLFKCRVVYDLQGKVSVEFVPYHIKKLSTFSLVDIGSADYPYKFEDRQWIMDLLHNSEGDEIIMCRNGEITDSSYANLVFFDGNQWVTPKHPLLQGTQRARLLKANLIKERIIRERDIFKFQKFKCINAMISWEEAPEYQIEQIKRIIS
ncbi:aminotransferase class IV [Muriicola sp. E247]|uniref:aminotransferase class IV n=1 Tax=Muriicola sp. E247 TaxID=3242730 RepID=UPI0035249C3E